MIYGEVKFLYLRRALLWYADGSIGKAFGPVPPEAPSQGYGRESQSACDTRPPAPDSLPPAG